MGNRDGWDHFDVIGILSDKSQSTVTDFYFSHAAFLRTLN